MCILNRDDIYKVGANNAALYLCCVSDFECHVLSYGDAAFGGDRARCWCLIACGNNMTQHESKTDPSLLKHYCSFIQGEITYRVRLLPKHKVSQTSPRYQPEIALLIHLSPRKELSFLV